LWTYVRDERPHGGKQPPAAAYFYSEDRKGEHPKAHLKGFDGALHADGYAGFNAIFERGRVTEVACWAHVRRKFFEVDAANASPIAKEALERIGALYGIEARSRGKPPDERRRYRQTEASALIADLKTWLDATLPKLSGKSELAQAMRYALGRWQALTRYLDDGRLAIDNNAAERALRGIALGRKNFYDHCQCPGHDKKTGSEPNGFSLLSIAIGRRRELGCFDGRSNFYPGIGYPMVTVRRKAASFYLRT
jgi:hypothetical protein